MAAAAVEGLPLPHRAPWDRGARAAPHRVQAPVPTVSAHGVSKKKQTMTPDNTGARIIFSNWAYIHNLIKLIRQINVFELEKFLVPLLNDSLIL